MSDKETLSGGNSNNVRKQGQTVIRGCGSWSPFIHKLLQFLEESGFDEAPRFLSTDGKKETLTFIEGEVGNTPLKSAMLSDMVVIEAAQLLCRLHDLTQAFIIPSDATFLLPQRENERHKVICHNDFAPYNCVFKDGHIVGIIDFDTAAPGERLWDIAYAVYRFAPLVTDSHCHQLGWKTIPNRASRLKLFCDAYGLTDTSRLIEMVIQRLQALINFMRDTSSNVEHIPLYLEDIAFIKSNRQLFEAALA